MAENYASVQWLIDVLRPMDRSTDGHLWALPAEESCEAALGPRAMADVTSHNGMGQRNGAVYGHGYLVGTGKRQVDARAQGVQADRQSRT